MLAVTIITERVMAYRSIGTKSCRSTSSPGTFSGEADTAQGPPGRALSRHRGVPDECGPGGRPANPHACKSRPVYAAVLEDVIRSDVSGSPEKAYKAGENRVEEPRPFHSVSANARDMQADRVLDADGTKLTGFVKK